MTSHHWITPGADLGIVKDSDRIGRTPIGPATGWNWRWSPAFPHRGCRYECARYLWRHGGFAPTLQRARDQGSTGCCC